MELIEAFFGFLAFLVLPSFVFSDSVVIVRTNKIVKSEISFADELSQFLTTECRRNRMLLKLDFNTDANSDRMTDSMSDLIWRGRICLNENSCCSNTDLVSKKLVLSVRYDRCGIQKAPTESGFKYVAQMGFKTKSNITTHHFVSCIAPFKTNDLTADFTSNEDSLSADSMFSTSIKVTGRRTHGFLQTYPLNCWFAFPNRSSSEEEKRPFIVNGCPTVEGVQIEQELVVSSQIKATRIVVPISAFFGDLEIPLSSSQEAKLQCDAILCSGSSENAFENVPTCPRTSVCLKQKELPLEVRQSPLVQAVRTLRILPSSGEKSIPNETTSNCSQQCAFELANALLSAQNSPTPPCEDSPALRQHSRNVSTGALVVVAIVSFLLGAALMAAMWYINVKTDPQRKVCTTTSDRNSLFPPSYSDSATCPPYDTSKDVRAFTGSNSERQLLMR